MCGVWDVDAPGGLADEIYAPDVVDHNPQPGQEPGRDGEKQVIALYHAVFPDLHLTLEDIVAYEDRAAVRWTAAGTHDGDQLGVPAAHRQVRLTGIDIIRVADGRIVERWAAVDTPGLLRQLDAPAPRAPRHERLPAPVAG